MRERKCPPGDVRLASLTIKDCPVTLQMRLGCAVEQNPMPSLPSFHAITVPQKRPDPTRDSGAPAPDRGNSSTQQPGS